MWIGWTTAIPCPIWPTFSLASSQDTNISPNGTVLCPIRKPMQINRTQRYHSRTIIIIIPSPIDNFNSPQAHATSISQAEQLGYDEMDPNFVDASICIRQNTDEMMTRLGHRVAPPHPKCWSTRNRWFCPCLHTHRGDSWLRPAFVNFHQCATTNNKDPLGVLPTGVQQYQPSPLCNKDGGGEE